MFDDNNHNDQDLMFRSILQEGQEEVPAHVWEGVSSGLDRIARRKKAVVIFRRSAVGVAVAAMLGLGVILSYDQGDISDPVSGEEMIAVVPQPAEDTGVQQIMIAETPHTSEAVQPEDRIIKTAAEAARIADIKPEENQTVFSGEEILTEEPETALEDSAAAAKPEDVEKQQIVEKQQDVEKYPAKKQQATEGQAIEGERFPDIWNDETPAKKPFRASLEISGLAGTNNSQNSQGKGLMKRPSISYTEATTGITENSTNSTFGIPVSFGAGVRFDFTPRWSLATGVRYTLLTRKFYGTYTSVDAEGNVDWTESSDIRNSQHFVGIPVNAFFNIVNRDFLRFYVYAGGAVEKCVADKYQVLSSSIVHTEKVKGIQLSVDAGVGVEFLLGKHLGIYIDPSLRYYFDNGQPTSIRTVRPLMLGFEAGLRVRL